GTVFEITKIAGGYANTPTVLVSFNGTNGLSPNGGLIADATGDLFGTTASPQVGGTVFEVARTNSGFASTPVVLANFSGAYGYFPGAGLTMDVAGNLFGTTVGGG